MAYINISEWTSELVCCWLKGLDDSMYKYISFFANNGVGGQQLLNIRPYELEQLGMYSIGHQEIILEAVENLRNFHYNLDKENLQFLALQVASTSRNLYRQLSNHNDKSNLETQILSDITRTIAAIKPLINWLDRIPFHGQLQFNEIRKNLSRLGLEMATIAQRDRFVENPVEQIRMTAEKLTKLADYIIQDITDPMLLQPASLNLVTLKKRENDVGFSIEPSFHGIHRISEIKYNSPAHTSGKIEDGDEIVQINYQTVVGWQYKTVIMQLRESSPDILLTLKKRPKHTKIYGQIYMQPYRLPSKKRALTTRWSDNLPSPRGVDFLTVPDFTLPIKMTTDEKNPNNSNNNNNTSSDSDSSCSDILTPTDAKSTDKEIRLYYPKPRAVLQRRNTICGNDLACLKHVGSVPLWHERRKSRQNGVPTSPSLRDKSVSFGYGLEITTRPTTCLGISSNTGNTGNKFNDLIGLNSSLPDINNDDEKLIKLKDKNHQDCKKLEMKSKPGVSKVVRFDANMKYDNYPMDNKYICNVENTILETFEPIPYADDDDDDADDGDEENEDYNEDEEDEDDDGSSQDADTPKIPIEKQIQTKIFTFDNNHQKYCSSDQTDEELCQAINSVMLSRRGRLDKSHSTPAYDNSGEEESDTPPPAIEPRKEFLVVAPPPVPPPRPKKQTEQPQIVPVPPPKPQFLSQSYQKPPPPPLSTTTTNIFNHSPQQHQQLLPPSARSNNLENELPDQLELMTPLKTKTLTLKKKNSLMAKRRKLTIKILGTGDIQGHLYRRTKDKCGVTFWAKLYFVLIETVLYGFRSKDARKANCMVVLPGFTVSLAKEVHSKAFAFKVYHSSKTFYFAAESAGALNQWMDLINQGTMKSNTQLGSGGGGGSSSTGESKKSINEKDLFSETDSSGDENDLLPKQICTPSPLTSPISSRDFIPTNKNHFSPPDTTAVITPKSDNKYLGSLKKLTKLKSSSSNSNNSNNNNSNSNSNNTTTNTNDKKNSSDIPVPTAQFRCYRRVPGGSYGLQIGTQTSPYHDSNYSPQPQPPSTQQQQQQQQFFPEPPPRKLSVSSSIQSSLNSFGELNHDQLQQISTPNTPNLIENEYQNRHEIIEDPENSSKLKLKRTSPYNFIHASNPNLVEFDFQTSKTLDHSMPKINMANSTWDAPSHSLQGFVTLKDLMLQKQEEDAQEMYNNRVLLGVEKKDKANNRWRSDFNKNEQHHFSGSGGTNVNNLTQSKIKSKIQMRSLPKTPDYAMSFKPDDEDIKRTRSKEGQKLRDFGYEFIYGDDPTSIDGQKKLFNKVQQQNSQILHLQAMTSSNKKKYSVVNAAAATALEIQQEKTSRTGSFRKTKGKFDAFKTSSEKIFQFKHHNNNNEDSKSIKSTTSYAQPMTLPLNKKSSQSQLYNIQADKHGGSQSNIKKSHTYNNEFKEQKKIEEKTHQRKNSAPMPILSKFSFSSGGKTVKEKKLLGSPRLHRAIFGRSSANNKIDHDHDHEIFCPITFTKNPQVAASDSSSVSTSFDTQSLVSINSFVMDKGSGNPAVQQSPTQSTSTSCVQTPEYPNMECPPVFEAETYSLSDPNASLTLLRRRNNLEDKNSLN